MEKKVLFARVSATNKKFADKQALKANRPVADYIDELISATRLKRPVKFDKKPTRAEVLLRKETENKKQKLRK